MGAELRVSSACMWIRCWFVTQDVADVREELIGGVFNNLRREEGGGYGDKLVLAARVGTAR